MTQSNGLAKFVVTGAREIRARNDLLNELESDMRQVIDIIKMRIMHELNIKAVKHSLDETSVNLIKYSLTNFIFDVVTEQVEKNGGHYLLIDQTTESGYKLAYVALKRYVASKTTKPYLTDRLNPHFFGLIQGLNRRYFSLFKESLQWKNKIYAIKDLVFEIIETLQKEAVNSCPHVALFKFDKVNFERAIMRLKSEFEKESYKTTNIKPITSLCDKALYKHFKMDRYFYIEVEPLKEIVGDIQEVLSNLKTYLEYKERLESNDTI